MSASRERKKREENSAVAQPEVKKSKKLSEGWIFAICMILIVAVVVGGMLIYRYNQNHKTVLTVGDHDVDVSEFNFFYREIAATCDQYKDYLGIDDTINLDEQKIDSSDTSMMSMLGINTTILDEAATVDGVYDITWAQLLADNAMRNAASAHSIYQAAEKAGYELDHEGLEAIESNVAQVDDARKTFNETNGTNFDLDAYLELVFGRDCDEDAYREYVEVVQVASTYPESIEYTVAEKTARDEKAPEDFDNVAFYYYVTDRTVIEAEQKASEEAEKAEEPTEESSEDVEIVEEEPTEEATEPELTDEEKAELDKQAKEAAEKMAADFNVDDEKVSIYADYTREILDSMIETRGLSEEAIEWLCGEAKTDDVKMFTIAADEEAEDSVARYIVVKFITRDDYKTVNHLYLTVAADAEDAELAEGEESAADKVARIKAALEADPSEENFRTQIIKNLEHEEVEGEEHDHSAEGVAENQSRYAFASVSKEIYNWMMVEERKAGDWTMIEVDGQTMFYFYQGEGQAYRDLCIENTMRNEWYTETTEAAIAACEYDEEAALGAEVAYYNN